MRSQKQNYLVYFTTTKAIKANKNTNILDLLKNNKIEEKKEKMLKFYILALSLGVIIFFITIIIL